MTEVLAAIGSVEKAKQAYDQVRGSDPGIPQGTADGQIPQVAQSDQSQAGMSQGGAAQAQAPAMAAPDMPMPVQMDNTPPPVPQQGSAIQQLFGNVYAGNDDGMAVSAQTAASNTPAPQVPGQNAPLGNSTQAPSSVGASPTPDQSPSIQQGSDTQQSAPITVSHDRWQNAHKEGLLGKIGDALLMMKGMNPIFRERTAQANERDIEHQYYKAMSDNPNDPNAAALAASRLSAVPGSKPEDAQAFMDAVGRGQYYAAGGQMRNDNRMDKGLGVIANMAGTIMRPGMPADQQAAAYTSLLPAMQAIAKNYGIPDDMSGSMLPGQFDATKIGALSRANESGYDQFREQLGLSNQTNTEAYRQSMINLRQQGLKLEGANTAIAAGRLAEQTDRDGNTAMMQRRSLYNNIIPPALQSSPLYSNFLSGVYGKGSNGMPVPDTVYVSKDKTVGYKMDNGGNWSIYALDPKNPNRGHMIKTIPSGQKNGSPMAVPIPGNDGQDAAPSSASTSGDFDQ